MSCKRFFHWGPALAIGIIKCITLTTLYMNSMWWPPNQSMGGMINQTVFLLLSSMTSFNYVLATLTGPGFLPKSWKPLRKTDEDSLQYCKKCEGFKAPRSHHCSKCKRCVKKMDHHCPWINTCVGWANHANFTSFLAFAVVGCFQSAICLAISFYRGLHRYWYLTHGYPELATVHFTLFTLILCVFSMGLAFGVVLAVGMLLYYQLRAILTNKTGIEDWIVEKANFRRKQEDLEPFVYPYDLGRWKNFRQVYGNFWGSVVGDGVHWPVVEGCNQYTLTSEQLEQKIEKRARTRTYKIIRPSTGRLFPIFSQGPKVALSPPCSDEARIKLSPGDLVNVTRWRAKWLFGEKVGSAKTKESIRGWFPRRCAVEYVMPSANVPSSSSVPLKRTNGLQRTSSSNKKKTN
ncbi:ZDHHC6 family protein [Megaselia abdita]